jgi:hypothetical protein
MELEKGESRALKLTKELFLSLTSLERIVGRK